MAPHLFAPFFPSCFSLLCTVAPFFSLHYFITFLFLHFLSPQSSHDDPELRLTVARGSPHPPQARCPQLTRFLCMCSRRKLRICRRTDLFLAALLLLLLFVITHGLNLNLPPPSHAHTEYFFISFWNINGIIRFGMYFNEQINHRMKYGIGTECMGGYRTLLIWISPPSQSHFLLSSLLRPLVLPPCAYWVSFSLFNFRLN